MSMRPWIWARKQKVGNATGKLILMMLADHADDEGRCFPGQEKLAQECECSVRTVREWLAKFEEMGLIKRDQRRRDDGYRTSDMIVICSEISPAGFSGENGSPEGISPENDADLTGRKCRAINRTSQKKTQKSLGASAPSEPAEPDHFETFWNLYPKREGPNPKKPAKLKFTRLVANGADPQQIIAAARELARHHPKPTRFCPQAVTWLNQERFSDADAAPPAAKVEDAAEWAKRLKIARLSKRWWSEWGPMPGDAGCRVPAHLLQPSDGDLWSERRRSA